MITHKICQCARIGPANLPRSRHIVSPYIGVTSRGSDYKVAILGARHTLGIL